MGKQEHSTSITVPARLDFKPEQVNLIRDTVAKDCSEPEFHLFLELAAKYELNPLAGEIYAAKMQGSNGGQGRMVPIVGRNGWLKMARRHSDFLGHDGDVVRANDLFETFRNDEGRRVVRHRTKQGVIDDKGTLIQRGPIVGAWAEIYRSGFPPTYFYAPIEEYKPSAPNSRSPWLKQESVMIHKCAMVTALRLTYSIGGVYDEAEMDHLLVQADRSQESGTVIDWGEDPVMADWLRQLVDAANVVVPGSWLPERTRLKLEGLDADGREALAKEITDFIQAKGGTAPEREPEDAEVVA